MIDYEVAVIKLVQGDERFAIALGVISTLIVCYVVAEAYLTGREILNRRSGSNSNE